MDALRQRVAGLGAVAAGLTLIGGSFLPWELRLEQTLGSSTTHSGMDCYCGGAPTFALGIILVGLGSAYLSDRHPWLPPFVGAIAWLPTIVLSLVAGAIVALVWIDALDDAFTDAVGVGVYGMAAGAALGLLGGILMKAGRPKRAARRSMAPSTWSSRRWPRPAA